MGALPLRDYVDRRFRDHERIHESVAAALDAATQAQAARFESVNEFRAQLSDQVARFVTRDTLDAIIATQQAKLDALAGAAQRAAIAAGIISAVLGVIGGVVLVAVLNQVTHP